MNNFKRIVYLVGITLMSQLNELISSLSFIGYWFRVMCLLSFKPLIARNRTSILPHQSTVHVHFTYTLYCSLPVFQKPTGAVYDAEK